MAIIQRVKTLFLIIYLFCVGAFASTEKFTTSLHGAIALGPKGFQRLLEESFEVVLPALEDEIKSQTLEIPDVDVLVPIKSEMLLENINKLTRFEKTLDRVVEYCDKKCLEYLKNNSIELDDLPPEVEEDTGFYWRSILTNNLSDQRKLEFSDFKIHDVSFAVEDPSVDESFDEIKLKLRVQSFHVSGNVNFYDLKGNVKLKFPIVINLLDQVESVGFDLALDVNTNSENSLMVAINPTKSKLLLDYTVLDYQLEVHTP